MVASRSASPSRRRKTSQAVNATPTAAPSSPSSSRPSWFSAMSWMERVTLVWLALDAFTHLTMEALYVILTMTYGGAANAPKALAGASFMWREYGRADSRWSAYDPTVLSLELITVLLAGPLALALFYAVARRSAWRHLGIVILSVCELYGGWLTFGPEWLARPVSSPALSGELYHQAIYLFFFNFLWVLIPAVLLYDHSSIIVRACASAAPRMTREPASGDVSYNVVAGSLVAYAILVPGVLAAAAMRP